MVFVGIFVVAVVFNIIEELAEGSWTGKITFMRENDRFCPMKLLLIFGSV